MIISTKKIKALNPCQSRFDNYLKNYSNFKGHLREFIMLENITYSDKVWFVTKLFTSEQNFKWSLLCASKVLHIFEERNPSDNRPRKALEAAEKWLNKPNEENRLIVNAAASAAYTAYVTFANTATDVANAAASAAYASAAYANVDYAIIAADYANIATKNKTNEEELSLLLMLECI